MNFNNIVQQQFERAGWKAGRNVLSKYDAGFLEKAPEFLKEFLKEYGNLIVQDAKSYESEVINELRINHDRVLLVSEDKGELDYLYPIIGKELYVFAFFYPDLYEIACDSEGKVYMLGDYVFLRSNNFKEGIERIILDDWSESLELNEETGEWTDKYEF